MQRQSHHATPPLDAHDVSFAEAFLLTATTYCLIALDQFKTDAPCVPNLTEKCCTLHRARPHRNAPDQINRPAMVNNRDGNAVMKVDSKA